MQEAPWMQTNISSMTFRFTEVCLLESTVPWSWLSRLRSKILNPTTYTLGHREHDQV